MSPDDIIKAVPEIASVAKVAAASIPFTGIVKRCLDQQPTNWRKCGEIKFACIGTSAN
jgi:hypothetical protein